MSSAKRFAILLIVGLMVTSCNLSPQAPEVVTPTASAGDSANPLGSAVTLCNDLLTLQTEVGQSTPKVPDQPRPSQPVNSGGSC